MESSFKKSEHKCILTFSGDLTVQYAAEMRELLVKALQESDDVLLEFQGVGAVDLSAMQLMCSAHRTATTRKKTLAYAGKPPEAYRNAMEESGYSRAAGCYLDSTKTCIFVPKRFLNT